ncbi:unnamed protein product [Prorocentrum cordatum]|uniref:Uncharacterized protein n=1 Tax=Prorocentrum cordatum TaxID=2364126 RepID=A0ABN9RIX8_9DINO|nr:unnamed protein product [Polarella glacialis]
MGVRAMARLGRQELPGRHGALLTGIAQVLGQGAGTEGAAAAASPAQSGVGTAMGREEEVPRGRCHGPRQTAAAWAWLRARARGAPRSSPRSPCESAGWARARAPRWRWPAQTGGSSTRSKEVTQMRTTAEITSHTLRDRGLNSALDRIGRQVRISQQPREYTDRTFRSNVAVVQRAAYRGTRNPWSDYCMSVIIIANCTVIGMFFWWHMC